MKTKLSTLTKMLLLIAAASMVIVLYTPIWRIDLDAPQYPEGLSLSIHASGLQGNVDIINGLNHYIGMKTLHNEDFIEFKVLPYAIIFFAILFAVTAFINKRWLLHTSFILFVLFGILAMYDFWKWEYDYGHNLDPNAAIKVPGMAYQPPLIGFKQLLNFGAYSIPDTGGWLFISAGVLLLACVIMEWKKNKTISTANRNKTVPVAVMLLLPFFLNSCQAGPDAIVAGKDNCYFCKMSISDVKYSAEAVTQKGKVYKFDDITCLLNFSKSGVLEDGQVKDIYLSNFMAPHDLLKADQAFMLRGGDIRGPMNGNAIAFSDKESLQKVAATLHAEETTWQQIQK